MPTELPVTHSPTALPTPAPSPFRTRRPGALCSKDDHGMTGTSAKGEALRCEDNNGWRWEPLGNG